MASYAMSTNYLRDNADQFSEEDMAALQAAMAEENPENENNHNGDEEGDEDEDNNDQEGEEDTRDDQVNPVVQTPALQGYPDLKQGVLGIL